MNVQSIRLENWKKFTEPVQIELKDGLNVLYGPNESGKSTLIDSIITTFYSKHTSGSGKIKSLKPWGTSLQPRSTITFSKNGQNYSITKGFQEKKCLLEKRGRWKLEENCRRRPGRQRINRTSWWPISHPWRHQIRTLGTRTNTMDGSGKPNHQ